MTMNINSNVDTKTSKPLATPPTQTVTPGGSDDVQVPEVLPPLTMNTGQDAPVAMSIYALLELLVKVLMLSRSGARATRLQELQAELEMMVVEANKMVEAAKRNYDAARAEAWAQVVAGSITIASGIVSLIGSKWTPDQPNTSNRSYEVCKAIAMALQGIAELFKGIGGVVKADKEYEAALCQAAVKLVELAEKYYDKKYTEENDFVADLVEAIRNFIQQLTELERARHEVAHALV